MSDALGPARPLPWGIVQAGWSMSVPARGDTPLAAPHLPPLLRDAVPTPIPRSRLRHWCIVLPPRGRRPPGVSCACRLPPGLSRALRSLPSESVPRPAACGGVSPPAPLTRPRMHTDQARLTWVCSWGCRSCRRSQSFLHRHSTCRVNPQVPHSRARDASCHHVVLTALVLATSPCFSRDATVSQGGKIELVGRCLACVQTLGVGDVEAVDAM